MEQPKNKPNEIIDIIDPKIIEGKKYKSFLKYK